MWNWKYRRIHFCCRQKSSMNDSFLHSEKINTLSLPLSQSSCISFTLHFSPTDALILISQPPQAHWSTSPRLASCLLQWGFPALLQPHIPEVPRSPWLSWVFELLESTVHKTDGTGLAKRCWGELLHPSGWNHRKPLEDNHPHSHTEGFAEYSQCSSFSRS